MDKEMQREWDAKTKWMLSLKVGDTVNDCRFKNLKIKEIHEVRITRVQLPLWSWVPMWAFEVFERVSRKLFGTVITDKSLILEDGNGCSAMHCCDPPTDEDGSCPISK